MGSPGDPAVNGGDAIYELGPFIFVLFLYLSKRKAIRAKAQKAAMSNCPPISCMRDRYGSRQMGAETRGGAYPDFYFVC